MAVEPVAADPAMSGRGVLLTRPEEESRALAPRIAGLGLHPIVMPTLEIVPLRPPPEGLAVLSALAGFDLAVFISRNAVRCGLDLVRAHGGWPPGLRAAAVGPATAEALCEQGVSEVIVPADGADSEALLRCPALRDVAGWRVAIFRGEGGRELLARTLAQRGAQVCYVECYRRAVPALPSTEALDALRAGSLGGVVAASSEGLGNLAQGVGEDVRGLLLALPLFVQHDNVARRARALGFVDVVVYDGGDAGLCEALRQRLAPPGAAG